MDTITLHVEGMMCKHCQARVEKALSELPEVTQVIVSLEEKTATVNGKNLSKDKVAKAIVDAGYEVK
mgnify:FL=1